MIEKQVLQICRIAIDLMSECPLARILKPVWCHAVRCACTNLQYHCDTSPWVHCQIDDSLQCSPDGVLVMMLKVTFGGHTDRQEGIKNMTNP